MQVLVNNFRKRLETQSIEQALIGQITSDIINAPALSTLQEVTSLIDTETEAIKAYYCSHPTECKANQNGHPISLMAISQFYCNIIGQVNRQHGQTIQEFKKGLKDVHPQIIAYLKHAPLQIASHWSSHTLLHRFTNVMIASPTQSVLSALFQMKSVVGCLKVFLVELTPMSKTQTQSLEGIRLNVEPIDFKIASHYMTQVNCLMIGASTMLENGAAVCETGATFLAIAAKHSAKKCYIFGQNFRLLGRTMLVQSDLPQETDEQGKKIILGDLVIPELIDGICTDSGVHLPDSLAADLTRLFHRRK